MTEIMAEAGRPVLAGRDEEKLMYAFFAIYKTARIYEQNNAVFQNRLDSFFTQFGKIAKETGDISIRVVADRFHINEKMVLFEDSEPSGAVETATEWEMLGIGGVRFGRRITRKELGMFFVSVSTVKPTSGNLKLLSASLNSLGLDMIQLLSNKEVGHQVSLSAEEKRRLNTNMARRTFFQAVSVVQEAVVNTMLDRDINISKTKRVVHTLVDHISREESTLLGLASIKDFDDYTYAHSANVSVYALTLGVRIGLDRARLSQLGFAAFFHDIGKVKLPRDLITKPESYDENDWIQIQLHPLLGTKTILRNMKLDVHTARAARCAFEHHINNDITGYPALHDHPRRPNLLSKIITIVDAFDSLTCGRLYMKKAFPADVAFKKMRFQMQNKFDPFLLKLFDDVIGVYPVGSMVLLTTNEIALIHSNNDRARPCVSIVGNRDGILENPYWADLSQQEHAHRSIIRTVEPARYGINTKEFILRD